MSLVGTFLRQFAKNHRTSRSHSSYNTRRHQSFASTFREFASNTANNGCIEEEQQHRGQEIFEVPSFGLEGKTSGLIEIPRSVDFEVTTDREQEPAEVPQSPVISRTHPGQEPLAQPVKKIGCRRRGEAEAEATRLRLPHFRA